MNIVNFFEFSVRQNKLSHLYLIVGPKGDRRDDLVLNVIKTLNQQVYTSKMMAQEADGIYWIEPEKKIIKKQQIVTLQEEFSKTSLSEGKRIYIIEDIEKMNVQSANALLKFLEEPLSTQTIGLLLTSEPQAILDTILSRAQLLKMPYALKEDVIQVLKDIDVDASVKSVISELTRDTTEALSLTQYEEIKILAHLLNAFPEYMTSKNEFEIFLLNETKAFTGDLTFFEYFIHVLYRFFLDLKKDQPFTFVFLEHKRETIQTFINFESLDDILQMLQQTRYELRYNIHLDTTRRKLIHQLKGCIKS